jgi:hypothetical protein
MARLSVRVTAAAGSGRERRLSSRRRNLDKSQLHTPDFLGVSVGLIMVPSPRARASSPTRTPGNSSERSHNTSPNPLGHCDLQVQLAYHHNPTPSVHVLFHNFNRD